jgi:hypothetical protein
MINRMSYKAGSVEQLPISLAAPKQAARDYAWNYFLSYMLHCKFQHEGKATVSGEYRIFYNVKIWQSSLALMPGVSSLPKLVSQA